MSLPPRQKAALGQKAALASGSPASLGSSTQAMPVVSGNLPLELRVQLLEGAVNQLAQFIAHVHPLGDAFRVESDGTVTLRKKLFIAPGADIEARD